MAVAAIPWYLKIQGFGQEAGWFYRGENNVGTAVHFEVISLDDYTLNHAH